MCLRNLGFEPPNNLFRQQIGILSKALLGTNYARSEIESTSDNPWFEPIQKNFGSSQ